LPPAETAPLSSSPDIFGTYSCPVGPGKDGEPYVFGRTLAKLAQEDPQKAKLVELRFFAGLSHEEAAHVLGISAATAKRHWRYARAWLHRQMRPGEGTGPES
jgi:DNA invertase Pin-like site-specific DNA recombinase